MPFNVTMPDGTVISGVPDGTTKAALAAKYSAHIGKGAGPQPSIMQTIAASPVGRFAHDAIGAPIAGIAGLLAKIDPTGGAVQPAIDASEASYQGALAAQRNRPGYAEARQQADARSADLGAGGFTDQMLSTVAPAMAGTVGLFGGGLNASNAAADAQTSSQNDYSAANPVKAIAGQVAGGFLGAPLTQAPQSAATIIPALPRLTQADAARAYVERMMSQSKTASTPAGLIAVAGRKPITSAEAIGRPAEVALGALARREGETADALGGQMATRTAAAPRRIIDDFAAASGIHPDAARGDIEAFVEANQKAANPLYEHAYKENTNISSPMLDRILETPAGKQALAGARTKMQNDMSLLGTPDAELIDQAREGGTALPTRGAASGMKLRVYDYVKRSLDDQISAAYRAGNKNEGNILKDLKAKLVNALDDADVTAKAGPNSVKPEGGAYAQARAKAGEYLSAKNQYELAQAHILDDKFPAKDLADHYAKLGPADKQAYLGGIANKIFNLRDAGTLKAGGFSAPIVQKKLAAVIGDVPSRQFIENMASEKKMADFAAKRSPAAGSPTAEYSAAMQDQDGASAMASHAVDLARTGATRGVTAAAMHGLGKITDGLVARYITSGMALPVRNEAGRLLLLPPHDLANELGQSAAGVSLKTPKLLNQHPLPIGLFGSGLLQQQRTQ